MKQDLTTGTWQDDTGCPISIILVSTSDDKDGCGPCISNGVCVGKCQPFGHSLSDHGGNVLHSGFF